MSEELKKFKIKLGKRIKYLREREGLTQPGLGALLNKDYQSIGRIENGRVNPSAFVICQIADALNVSFNEIFDFSEME